MSEFGLSGRAVAARLVASIALFFVLPVAFLTAYVLLLDAPPGAAWLHLYVIGAAAGGLIGARVALSFLPIPSALRRLLSALLMCGVSLALICLYTGCLIGLKYWGRVTTVDLVSTYVAQAPALLRALGYSPVVMFLACAALLIIGIAVADWQLRRNDWVAEFRRHVSPFIAAIVSIGLLLAFALFALGFQSRDWGRQGEPLSLSLFPNQASTENQNHGIDVFRAAAIQREEERARDSYATAASSLRSNVILIVVDALRADRLSLLGYGRKTTPGLEALRDAGRMPVATSVVSVCNESSCGLRALASSRYADRQADGPITLHEVMKKHGYRIHMLFAGDHVNFYGIDGIYGPVDSYFDGASQTARYINDDRLVADRLATFPAWDGTPTMFQFHLMSTHALGQRFDPKSPFGPSRNYAGNTWLPSDTELPQLASNYYDAGVLQTDGVIVGILGQLSERGYLKDAVVVITGDHGESLGERGFYAHTNGVWEESLRVPLIVIAYGDPRPDQLSRRSVISQIDIAPTILHMLGMPQPSTWQGSPLQKAIERRFVNFQQGQFIGLVDTGSRGGLYKHWVDTRSGQVRTFNLTTDPGERNDVTDKVPLELRQQWKEELLRHADALPADRQDVLRGSAR